MLKQRYLFGDPEDYETDTNPPSAGKPEQHGEATSAEERQLLLPGMKGGHSPERSAAITELLGRIDGMNSFEIAREFGRLGIESPNKIFPDLTNLILQRTQGIIILLNLVRLGRIPSDNEGQAIAETTYQQLGRREAGIFELAEVVDRLSIPLQPSRGKYRKMNGLIRILHTTLDGFHSCMRGGISYWKEVLPRIASGEVGTLAEACDIQRRELRANIQNVLKA